MGALRQSLLRDEFNRVVTDPYIEESLANCALNRVHFFVSPLISGCIEESDPAFVELRKRILSNYPLISDVRAADYLWAYKPLE